MGFLTGLWHFAQPLLTPLGVVFGSWLHTKLSKVPTAAEKAAHLAQLAKDAAGSIYLLFPTLPNQELVQKIVNLLSSIAGVPTTDPTVLERAAQGALATLKAPAAATNGAP